MKNKEFNIVITGTGGQGLITLLQLLAESAFIEGYDVKTSELHGLSQRGGAVEVHIRFGKKIYSPLISQGRADLIIGLEAQETLRGVSFANSSTVFLVNDYFVPIPFEKSLSKEEIVKSLKGISKKTELIPASSICKESLGTDVTAGVYLISLAVSRGIIPLEIQSVKKAINKIFPQKYLDLNLKTLELAERKI